MRFTGGESGSDPLENAKIKVIVNETTCFSSMDDALTTEPFMLVSTPHQKRVKGFPPGSAVHRPEIDGEVVGFIEPQVYEPVY